MKDKYKEILKSAKEVLVNMDTDEFLDKFLKIQDSNKEKEGIEINDVVTVEIKARNYYPNYMVVHDLDKEELYSIAESVSDFGVIVIPIYTRSVYEVVDFSDYNLIDFSGNIIRPFYVGDNKELEREIIKRTVDMIYEQVEVIGL